MKKYIVITTINSPTEAVIKYANLEGYETIIIGDKKTPQDWQSEGVKFLSITEQKSIGQYLDKVLPYNHYCRKMMGYLYAIINNSDIIIDTDDDNIPYDDWKFPETEGSFLSLAPNLGFVNIYQIFTNEKIWPRGLPLQYIQAKFNLTCKKVANKILKVGIWQGLADEDPDVDAIYRLTSNKVCNFHKHEPVVLSEGTISPFNSQNTLIIKELFPLLYLPTSVTFRFTDILRGLVAQPIMWQNNYRLGFLNATVTQKRNPHDYFEDFLSEIPMYLHTEKIIDIIMTSIKSKYSITDNLYEAYQSLYYSQIVDKSELVTLNAWLKDIDK
jgi:hypothetical protein